MEKYTAYKDSGIQWIGDIPTHWEIKRLKYVASANPSNVDKKSKNDEDEVYLCNYIDVYKNDYITSEIKFMQATASKEQIDKFALQKGDIIATKDSEKADDIGVPALVTEDLPEVICGYHLTHIKPKHIKGDFLFRFFQTSILSNYFEYLTNGITRFALGVDHFNSIPVVIPPLPEQDVITNYLKQKTADIDQLIVDKQNLIELYQKEKTAIINQAVTKGIDSDVKLKPSGIKWLEEIPEHWEVKRLKYLVSINDEVLSESTNENYILEYVEISDVKNGEGITSTQRYSFKDAPSRARRVVKDGDVIVSTVRTYLKSIAKISNPPSNMVVSTGFVVIRPRFIDPDFLGFTFYTDYVIGEIISQSVGVSYPAINSSLIGEISIPFPKREEEQQQIVNYIEKELQIIDQKIEKNQKLIKLLTEYRTTLINEVVTGKVKVTPQTPNN